MTLNSSLNPESISDVTTFNLGNRLHTQWIPSGAYKQVETWTKVSETKRQRATVSSDVYRDKIEEYNPLLRNTFPYKKIYSLTCWVPYKTKVGVEHLVTNKAEDSWCIITLQMDWRITDLWLKNNHLLDAYRSRSSKANNVPPNFHYQCAHNLIHFTHKKSKAFVNR
jgi:hypothetical protein